MVTLDGILLLLDGFEFEDVKISTRCGNDLFCSFLVPLDKTVSLYYDEKKDRFELRLKGIPDSALKNNIICYDSKPCIEGGNFLVHHRGDLIWRLREFIDKIEEHYFEGVISERKFYGQGE